MIESYFLDSLWKNLQKLVKTEERALDVPNFQHYIPPTVETPPTFQVRPVVPNHHRLMVAIFSPLALLAILHDLPKNYGERITLYDGEGSFTTKKHVDKFEDLNDLEEVDDDDIKMRLFS